MFDTELSLEAKAIYAYLSSFAGNKSIAFPSRGKILSDLRMSKSAYYRHYSQLIKQGYIKAYQRIINGKKNGNVYTIVASPDKFWGEADPKDERNYERIRDFGLKELGYGFIPKLVMQDQRLTAEAKGIYAFFKSLCGNVDTAYPEHKDILYFLGISEAAYYHHYNLLVDLNYITPTQRHMHGHYSVCDYVLNGNPDVSNARRRTFVVITDEEVEGIKEKINEELANEEPANENTLAVAVQPEEAPTPDNKLASKEDAIDDAVAAMISKIKNVIIKDPTKAEEPLVINENQAFDANVESATFQTAKTATPETQDAVNKSNFDNKQHTKSINLSVSKISDGESTEGRTDEQTDGRTDRQTDGRSNFQRDLASTLSSAYPDMKSVYQAIRDNKTLPYEFTTDRYLTLMAVHIFTEYDFHYKEYNKSPDTRYADSDMWIFCLFNEALIDMLTSKSLMKLNNSHISNRMVYDKLTKENLECFHHEDGDNFSILNLVEQATSDFEKGYKINCEKHIGINHKLKYMQSCIWNAMQVGGDFPYFLCR
jgi:hypothetical protein